MPWVLSRASLAAGLLLDARARAAALQLGPHRLGREPLIGPQHEQVIEEVGALMREFRRVPFAAGDHRLDRLLAQLLRDLGRALLEQLGGVRALGIAAAAA